MPMVWPHDHEDEELPPEFAEVHLSALPIDMNLSEMLLVRLTSLVDVDVPKLEVEPEW